MARKVEVDLKLLIVAVAFVILATVGSAFTTYLIFRGNAAQTPQGAEASVERRELGPTYELGSSRSTCCPHPISGASFARRLSWRPATRKWWVSSKNGCPRFVMK